MVTLFCVECQILKFFLIFTIVQNCLWQYYILINNLINVLESGPFARVYLHHIKHHAGFHSFLCVIEISQSHPLQQLVLLLLKVLHLLLCMHGDFANGSAPSVHITPLLFHLLSLPFVKVCILNLSLALPVLLHMLLPHLGHFDFVFAEFFLIDGVWGTASHSSQEEH